MEIEGYLFPEDLYYHKEHFWAKVEGNIVTMGTNDFAQKLAGQIVYVEMPAPGRNVEQGNPVAPWSPGNGSEGSMLRSQEKSNPPTRNSMTVLS